MRQPLGDAHRAAGGDRARIVEEGLDDPQERIALQDRIGIDTAKERETRHVDPGIQRVGLATVLLVDNAQIRVDAGTVDAADFGAGQLFPQHFGEGLQGEFARQRCQRRVARSIVNDDDLELRIVELQQRTHRSDNDAFLVVGGDEQADRLIETEESLRQIVEAAALHVTPQAQQRQQVEQ